jgi:hypothetical protein
MGSTQCNLIFRILRPIQSVVYVYIMMRSANGTGFRLAREPGSAGRRETAGHTSPFDSNVSRALLSRLGATCIGRLEKQRNLCVDVEIIAHLW